MTVQLYLGDCLEILPTLPEASVEAIVCDPPYELGFMGKSWDKAGIAFDPATWRACLRVLKPGGHLLAFGGTRTHHRIWCAIEDAGFEVRDTLCWLYGSGFPKSLDISKALDKMTGAEREVVGRYELPDVADGRRRKGWECTNTTEAGVFGVSGQCAITAPATAEARQWDGWGTALKPAYEPIVLARKPLAEGTVARNVLAYGTGGLNIDGCRIETRDNLNGGGYSGGKPKTMFSGLGRLQPGDYQQPAGRWPPNVCLDEEAAAMGDEQSGRCRSSGIFNPTDHKPNGAGWATNFGGKGIPGTMYGDTGGASRFFYCAKASRAEREMGCEGIEHKPRFSGGIEGCSIPLKGSPIPSGANTHPTVKPLALMRWLVRLVTPPGGTVLDPFMGSGTTGIACAMEGFRFIGIEREEAYYQIAERRIARAQMQPALIER